jgi:dienelactone hydrolase
MRRLVLLTFLIPFSVPTYAADPADCLRAAGGAGARCLAAYQGTIERCRRRHDAACETAARANGGALATILTAPAAPIRGACDERTAVGLGDLIGLDDLVSKTSDGCALFGDEFLTIDWAADTSKLSARAFRCQRTVAGRLDHLRDVVVREFGPRCYVRALAGGTCRRKHRDHVVAREQAATARRIRARCGADFDGLGLATGTSLEARVGDLVGRVVDRARHFAQRVYPPNTLGATARLGSFPIGVRTLDLADNARLNVAGTGPRPVRVEVYYPSTTAAVAGVAKDVIQVLGVNVVTTPAYRDVARAAGPFPLVLFSHGNNGIRFQSFFFAAHLASHGFVVISPDHHGNTFVDSLLGVVDPQVAVNRPLDMSFLIDQFLAMNTETGNFFAGAIDPARIGLSGHSFGGYTTFALAGGAGPLGTFTDARVKAIFPQAPAALFPDEFFATIVIPSLIVGGSIDVTTPFDANQQRPFDHLPTGASVVGVAELDDAGHFTFSDFCEVPGSLLNFLGGFDEACEPRHIPWRWAHDIVNYLSLAFFDGVLNGNQDALARLGPANLATVEDLRYQSK